MQIGIVIVTFNRKELFLKILKALEEQTYKKTKLYIIDNNSLDNTKENLIFNKYLLEEKIIKRKNGEEYYDSQEIMYLRLNENLGGAGGFSRGIKEAIREENDFIWLMDDDIIPEKDYLKKCIDFINKNKNEEIGAVTGVRYEKGIPIFCAEAKEFNFKDCFTKGFKQTFPNLEELKEKKVIQIKDFPFEGPLINSKIIKKVGYPNEKFFIIGDDTDYALRLGAISNFYMLTDLRIERLIPMTKGNKKFSWKEYYFYRNIFYINRIYAFNYKVKYLRNVYIFLRAIGGIIRTIVKEKKIAHLKSIPKLFEAYIDSFDDKLGKKYVPGDF